MSRFGCHRSILAALLATPLLVAGCRSRAEFVEGPLPDPSAQAVSTQQTAPENSQPDDDDADIDPKTDNDSAAFGWEEPDGGSEPVSLDENRAATPESILANADVVIDYDKHERPVGVDLTTARISADVIRAVAELTDLHWVDMRGARITDADVAIIGALPRLQLLALGDTQITDSALAHLIHQQDLRFLSLDRTKVTDDGLMTIAGLPRLEGISLLGTSVSQAGAQAFEAATPGCKAILDANAPLDAPSQRPPAPSEPSFPSEDDSASSFWNFDDTEQEPVATVPQPQQSTPPTRGFDQSSETLSTVLQRKLLDPEVLQALAQHLIAEKNYGNAARVLEALVALQPDNQQARFDLGVALGRSGHLEAAQPHLTQVVGEPTALYNLGVIAYDLGRDSRSEWYFAQAVEMAPEFAEARDWLDRLRLAESITPASHTPQPVDTDDLMNLLMSELGSGEALLEKKAPSTGIEIVPANRSPAPTAAGR